MHLRRRPILPVRRSRSPRPAAPPRLTYLIHFARAAASAARPPEPVVAPTEPPPPEPVVEPLDPAARAGRGAHSNRCRPVVYYRQPQSGTGGLIRRIPSSWS